MEVITRYAQVFGETSLAVRVFDSAQFKHGSIFDDFLGQLAFDETCLDQNWLTPAVTVNPSLSDKEADILRRINRFRVSARIALKIPAAAQLLSKTPITGKKLALTGETHHKLIEKYSTENLILEKKYLVGQQLKFKKPEDQQFAKSQDQISRDESFSSLFLVLISITAVILWLRDSVSGRS